MSRLAIGSHDLIWTPIKIATVYNQWTEQVMNPNWQEEELLAKYTSAAEELN